MTAIDVGRQVLTAAVQIGFVVAGFSILWFWSAPIPVYIVVLAVFWRFVRGQVPMRPSFDVAAWGRMLRPTLAVALATSAGSLYLYTAMVVIGQVTTRPEVGQYAAAFRVYVIVASVPALLATIIFPVLTRAARDDRARLAYLVARTFEGTALLGAAALVGCVVGAPVIIDVIGGPQYTAAIPVLRVMGVALAMTFVIAGLGFTLLALRAHRIMVAANAAAMLIVAVGVAILGHAHGAVGGAIGGAIGEVALGILAVLAVRHAEPTIGVVSLRTLRIVPAVALAVLCVLLPIPPLPQVC